MARDVTPSAALRCAVSQAPGASKAKGAAMTGDQENAESGKALFDLISHLSAGYRTNAVLTAGLHLAASALVLSSDSLEQAEQQAEMWGERFIAAVPEIWALNDGTRH